MANKSKKSKQSKKQKRIWRFLKFQIFLILLVVAALLYYYLGGYATKISSMRKEAETFVSKSTAETFKQSQTSIAYDTEGNVISILKGDKNSYYVPLEDMPAYVENAFISVEDKNFMNHHGIDYKGIARALWGLVTTGKVTSGGSTITQQLARNVFLNQDVTITRKLEEIFIASELEEKYTKEQILEFYINNIYYGNGFYGIEAAARGYFNKNVKDLTLSEIALLAGLPNSPTEYDPFTNLDKAVARRNIVLNAMLEDRAISKNSYDTAIAEAITLNRPEAVHNNYQETFTFYCATRVLMEQNGFKFKYTFKTPTEKQKYEEEYNQAYDTYNKQLYNGGYRIYTSLDSNMQGVLQNALDNGLGAFQDVGDDGIYKLQASAVCIDNSNGYVKAIVGGRTQNISGYTLNRAYQSYRQPGSAIKPLIVYTPLLEKGFTPDTIVEDRRIDGGPTNADKSYDGQMTLRRAVQLSKNTVAWSLFERITPKAGINYLRNMEFTGLEDKDETLAAALGGFTNGVSALEMTKAYATLANDGMYRGGTCIMKITDFEGETVYQNSQVEKEIYKESAARTMTDIL
ncbi:MAG: transglycosylase domain-containing protein, partial [Lachnospiraceae bacterium]|nr:transglycosylase domain-containing protein [Lachnospiraceae bacterium]